MTEMLKVYVIFIENEKVLLWGTLYVCQDYIQWQLKYFIYITQNWPF